MGNRVDSINWQAAAIVVSVLLLSLASLAGLGQFLLWSTKSIDSLAESRERQAITRSVGLLRSDIGKQQEGMTIWPEAVDEVSRPDNYDWIDENLGAWMHTFFGLDELYIVDAGNRPIYAFDNGSHHPPEAFEARGASLRPLIDRMRRELREGASAPAATGEEALNVSDYMVIDHRPVLVSIKPIIADLSDLESRRDDFYLHIAILYLDGAYLTKFSSTFNVQDFAFSWTGNRDDSDVSLPLVDDEGKNIGYFVWQSFRPGFIFVKTSAPVLGGAAIAALLVILALTVTLANRWKNEVRRDEKLRYLAHHDWLTSLPNRVSFEGMADRLLAETVSRGLPAGLLYLDIDRFKAVNDTRGHAIGDKVIVEVADRIRMTLAEDALLSRFGGDEFVAALPNCNRDLLREFGRALIEVVNQPIVIDGEAIKVGLSIGVAVAPDDGIDRRELTRKADVSLYAAKAAGRNRVVFFGDHIRGTDDGGAARPREGAGYSPG